MASKLPSDGLTHLDEHGRARMVSVAAKHETMRTATACAAVSMSAEAFEQVVQTTSRKGDAVQVARIAGIMAAKKTSELIPLCHPVRLVSVQIEARAHADTSTIELLATAVALDRTGVEMEAMTGASVAGLALYDMIKGIDRAAEIRSVRLLSKTGGKSGDYQRNPDR